MKKLTHREETLLLDAAQTVRQNSYSPYSGFKVGAALLTRKGNIYAGTNIENAAYAPRFAPSAARFLRRFRRESGAFARWR